MPEPSRIVFILAPAMCALGAAAIAQQSEDAGSSVAPSSVYIEFATLPQSVGGDSETASFPPVDDAEAVRFLFGGNPACGPDAGPCSEANGSPGCDDTAC